MQLGGLGIDMHGLHQHGHQITQTQGDGVVEAISVVVVSSGDGVVVVASVVVGSIKNIIFKILKYTFNFQTLTAFNKSVNE